MLKSMLRAGNSGLLECYRLCKCMFCSLEGVWEQTPCDERLASSVSPLKRAMRRECEPSRVWAEVCPEA